MTPDRREFLIAGGAAVAGLATAKSTFAADDPESFIHEHVLKMRPLELAGNRAWWDANTSGKDEDFKRKEDCQNKIDSALADKKMFGRAKTMFEKRAAITDVKVKRQIELLYLQYLEKQVDPELMKKMTAKANAVEQAFNVFRPNVDGKEM